jgi:polyhydroxyalkanoate synthesis regulator phasin
MDLSQLEQDIETEDATPEEQAEYEQAADVALRALHSGKTAKNTVNRVLNGKTPQEGVANAVFVLIRRTEEQMKGLSDAVKIQIGEDLVEEVLDLMVESGRMTEGEVTDEFISEVVNNIYQTYVEDAEQRGSLDTDKISEDVNQGAEMLGIEKPQGYAAMSNQEVESRGLMQNV